MNELRRAEIVAIIERLEAEASNIRQIRVAMAMAKEAGGDYLLGAMAHLIMVIESLKREIE